MLQRNPRALGHAKERFLGKRRLDSRAAKDEFGKIAQERGPARHDNPAVNDVGRELRRRLLEHVLHCLEHLAQFPPDGAHHFVGLDLRGARQSRDKVAAFDENGEFLLKRHRGANLNLNVLGHLVANRKIEGLFDVVGNGRVKAIARALDRGGRHDAAERDNRNVGRPPADVHHHVPRGFVNRNACADGRKNRLLHHISVLGAGLNHRLNHRAPLR